jgi:hypothetical protein
LVETNLENAVLTGCRIYGISAWNLKLSQDTIQQDLVITERGEPKVTVDNIEVAQFVHLLLRNEKIRDVIDTVGKKGVLLLGRFTERRIAILELCGRNSASAATSRSSSTSTSRRQRTSLRPSNCLRDCLTS